MPATPKAHRASAQRRRDALLEAAAQLSAELGAGAVTHRAVAARAGVPLSTTSYFFASIDDLVTEALRVGAEGRVRDFEETEAVATGTADCPELIVDAGVARAMETDRALLGDQIEFLLAAGRQPELRGDATGVVEHCVELIADRFGQAGAPQAATVAEAINMLLDGSALHRFAELEVDHAGTLRAGLRLLVAAAMLRDDEIAALLDRYNSTVAAPAEATPEPV